MKLYKFLLFTILVVIAFPSCKTLSSYPIEYYQIKAEGSPPQMKVRMISDHASIKSGQTFRLGFFFRLDDGYYTYTADTGRDNLPTELILSIPENFEIINVTWPEPKIKSGKTESDKEIVYDEDFKVIYTIRAPDQLPNQLTLGCAASWQVCKSELCTLGGANFKLPLSIGKKKKSALYRIF